MESKQDRQERLTRLLQWLESNPQEWCDLRSEIEFYRDNVRAVNESGGYAMGRDFMAGQCNAVGWILNMNNNIRITEAK